MNTVDISAQPEAVAAQAPIPVSFFIRGEVVCGEAVRRRSDVADHTEGQAGRLG